MVASFALSVCFFTASASAIAPSSVWIETEGGRVQKGSIVCDMAAYNDKAVNFIASDGTAGTYYFDSTEATTFQARLYVKAAESGSVKLIVNGSSDMLDVPFAASDAYTAVALTIGTQTGMNEIHIVGASTNVTIDTLEFLEASGKINREKYLNLSYPNGKGAPETGLFYLAKDAEINLGELKLPDQSVYSANTIISGDVYAGGLTDPASRVTFNHVYSENGGNYLIRVCYAATTGSAFDFCAHNYKQTVTCDAALGAGVFCDGVTRSFATLVVRLEKGFNQIVLSVAAGSVDFDCLEVIEIADDRTGAVLEAEQGNINFGVVYTLGNALGGRAVGSLDSFAGGTFPSFISWRVYAKQAGTYNAALVYLPNTDGLTGSVYVNPVINALTQIDPSGPTPETFEMPATNGLSQPTAVGMELTLAEGYNTILFTISAAVANATYIDYLYVDSSDVTFAPVDASSVNADGTADRYEAENAVVNFGAAFSNSPYNVSNGYYVTGMHFKVSTENASFPTSSGIYFNQIYAEEAGYYWVKIKYAAYEAAEFTEYLQVNGYQLIELHPDVVLNEMGNFSDDNAYALAQVYLNKGYNQLRYLRGTSGTVDLDYLEIVTGKTMVASDFAVSGGSVKHSDMLIDAGAFIYNEINNSFTGYYDIVIKGNGVDGKAVRFCMGETDLGSYTFVGDSLTIPNVKIAAGKNNVKLVSESDGLAITSVKIDKAEVKVTSKAILKQESGWLAEAEALDMVDAELVFGEEYSGNAAVKLDRENASVIVKDFVNPHGIFKVIVTCRTEDADAINIKVGSGNYQALIADGVAEYTVENEGDTDIEIGYLQGTVIVDKVEIQYVGNLVFERKDMRYSGAVLTADGIAVDSTTQIKMSATFPFAGQFDFEIKAKSGDAQFNVNVNGTDYAIGATAVPVAFADGVNQIVVTVTSGSGVIETLSVLRSGATALGFDAITANSAKNGFEVINENAIASGATLSENGWTLVDMNAYVEYNVYSLLAMTAQHVSIGVVTDAGTISVVVGEETKTVNVINGVATVAMDLVRGNNYIQVKKAEDKALTVTGVSTLYKNVTDAYTRYEAEDQSISGATYKGYRWQYDYGTYSGFGFVGNLDTDKAYIKFEINVAEAGEYKVRLAYATAALQETNPAVKLYDGTTVLATLKCSVTTNWGEFTEETITEATLMLKAGKNTVLLKKSSQSVEIDYLEIGEKVGDYKAPGYNNEFDGNFDDGGDDGFNSAKKDGCGSALSGASLILASAALASAALILSTKKRRHN